MSSYVFIKLDDPSAIGGTFAHGINDSGQVVGYYYDSQGSHGFLLNGGYSTFTCVTQQQQIGTNGYYESETLSSAEGINNSGQIVGSGFWQYYGEIGQYGGGTAWYYELFDSAYDGFIANLTGSSWSDIQAPINGTVIYGTPSSVRTYAYGVNSRGDVVGYYTDAGGSHAYLALTGPYNPQLQSHPNIQEMNYPGVSGATYARGISDQEQVVGYFIGTDPNQPSVSTAHGFLYHSGAFSYFDVPNAVNGTYAESINNVGQIVGYYVDGNGNSHGFIFNEPTGTYTTVDVPGAVNTYLYGMNNLGDFVGDYVDISGRTHGFMGTPPPPTQVHANDLTYAATASGYNHFIDLLNFEASFPDLIAAFGINQTAMQNWYNQHEPTEKRVASFDGLDYVASYSDLIKAFASAGGMRAVEDAGASHYIQKGFSENRQTTFNGLDYIASYKDLIAAFGANSDAGAFHFIEVGLNEHRATTFDGLDYIASYSDLMHVFGANEQAGAAHFIQLGSQENRSTSFDGLSYIAQYPDLMKALGANNDAGAKHYIGYGANEGRTTSFNVAAYEQSHPDLIGQYATPDQFLSAYINYFVATGHYLP